VSLSREAAKGCAVLWALAAIACRNPDGPDTPERFYTLRARAGAVQTAPAGSVLPDPLTVLVTDSIGTPVRGAQVAFRVVGGRGAQLLDSLVLSDAEGVAATRLRLGPERDTAVVQAAVPGRPAGAVRFLAVATAAAALTAVQPQRLTSGDTVTVRGRGLTRLGEGVVLFGTARGRVLTTLGDTAARVLVPACLPAGDLQVSAEFAGATTNAVPVVAVDGERTLTLAPHEAQTTAGSDASACVRLAGDGVRYLVFPQFANADDPTTTPRPYALTIEGANDSAVLAYGDPASTVAPTTAIRPPTPGERLERALRGAESSAARAGAADEAETLAGAAGVRRPGAPSADLAPLPGAVAPEPPPLGSERSFRVLSRIDLSAYATSVARLRYAGAHVLVYEDRAAPEPVDAAALARFGDLLDRTLYELGVQTFGAESDVDNNGRVIVLLTPIVNALTTAAQCGADGYVRGFFYSADLGTRNANSNRAEVLYGLVPDAAGTRSCPHSVGDVLQQLPATFIHELQHMISFNQKVIVRRGSEETTWLNEGLSHVAEEVAGRLYEARYPAPLGRLFGNQVLPDSAIPFYRGDIENAILYLSATPTHSVSSFSDLGTLEERGASWLFVRWLAAQKGSEVLGRLSRSPRTGRRSVEEVTGEPFGALFADFVVALSADSVPGVPRTRIPARYRFDGRPLRDLIVRGLGRTRAWPLVNRPAPLVGATATGAMVPATFEVFDLTAPRGRAVALRFSAPGGAPFSGVTGAQLGVLRLSP
jgi:hypothetical protein